MDSNHNLIGSFVERPFPEVRSPTIDTLTWGRKRHHIPILLEMDVTVARAALRAQKRQTGQGISFTGWLVKCIAQAVSEHPFIHGIRKGRRRIVLFDDVDVAIIVERAVGQSGRGETLPMPYIIRQANQKTVAAIHAEIRTAQQQSVPPGEVQIGSTRGAWLTQIFTLMPRWMRDFFVWRPLFRNPFQLKRRMGTVAVTALAMAGQTGLSWGIPIGIHPLIVAVGAIAKRPGVIDDQIVVREYVGLTVLFDHDVTDGAPVAHFVRRLQALIGSGYGLPALPDPTEPHREQAAIDPDGSGPIASAGNWS